jgi:mannose PTS system EIID component
MTVSNERRLTKKDIVGSFWRWMFFCHSCYNYEVYQGLGFTQAMAHSMKKLYPDKAELGRELSKHAVFFNTSTHMGSLTHGAVLALEEERANGAKEVTPELINSIKAGLMGPLAGIGDSVVQGIITPIFVALGMMFAETIGATGVLLYVIAISAAVLGIAYASWMQGYKFGVDAVSKFISGGMMQKVLGAAGILGCTVLGGLVGRFVNITTALRLQLPQADFILQTDFFDKLVPKFLPITITLLMFWLLRKGVKSNQIIFGLFIAGLVLALLGVLGPVPVR